MTVEELDMANTIHLNWRVSGEMRRNLVAAGDNADDLPHAIESCLRVLPLRTMEIIRLVCVDELQRRCDLLQSNLDGV